MNSHRSQVANGLQVKEDARALFNRGYAHHCSLGTMYLRVLAYVQALRRPAQNWKESDMNVQENKVGIFIQTAAMLRLSDSANQDHETSNKKFEEEIKQGRTE